MRTRAFHNDSEGGESGQLSATTIAFASRPADLAAFSLLVFLICTAWCVANAKWGPTDWSLPTTYVDPMYGDFLGACGPVKARSQGHLTPFAWKTIPELAAPDGASWNLSPTPDEPLFILFGALAWACGLFSGFNLGVLLGHLAAAITFYLVARMWLEATPLWAFVTALAFGLAPYLFAESPHHVNCQYVWHLPLFPLVWASVAVDPGLQWRTRRLWQAIAIGFVTGLQNPYYTYIFCQLTLLGGFAIAWRSRSWRALGPALAVVAAAAAAFFVSELDTLTYRLAHLTDASAPIVAERQYKWMDIYGLKVVDMFIPSFTHHSETLAHFGLAHRRASVLNDEEGCAYLGILGICCLLILVAATVRAFLDCKLAAVPIQAWWVLWIVLFFNTGGLNSLLAAFTGFTLFRTACRYSVVILVISLLYAAQRLSDWQRQAAGRYPADMLRIGTITAAIAACLLVIWDQVPRPPAAEQTALIAKLVESDRAFVGRLQATLPDKGMIFQLPVMDGTPLPGVPASDHYRPYLYSTSLHWSNGALPGSKTLQWQQSVQQKLVTGATVDQQAQQVRFNIGNVRQAVDEMRQKGFAAIYVNRNGFPDRGKGLFDALLELGYDTPPIYSSAGDLACIPFGNGPAR
jgi:hypothetical protein